MSSWCIPKESSGLNSTPNSQTAFSGVQKITSRSLACIAGILPFVLFLSGCQVIGLQIYRNTGASMEPLLHEGDRILVSGTYYHHHPFQDGDIIVFRHNGNLLIKRITAIPGERIEGRTGTLFRNGQRLPQPTAQSSTAELDPKLANFQVQTVPEGQLFVTGDNLAKSFDSREPGYGPVRTDDVVGRFMSKY